MRSRAMTVVGSLVLLGGCMTMPGPGTSYAPPVARQQPVATTVAPERERDWEPWPPPDARPNVARKPAGGEMIDMTCPDEGMTVLSLLRAVSEHTGVVFQHSMGSYARIALTRVHWTGVRQVPKSRMLDFCRSLVWTEGLLMSRAGPAEGTETWAVVGAGDPVAKTSPVHLREEEIFAHEDRDGLLVATSFRVRDTIEPAEMERLIASLRNVGSHRGGVGHASGSRTVSAIDMAPTVAAMKRIVDEANRNAAPPRFLPPKPAAAPKPSPPPSDAPK